MTALPAQCSKSHCQVRSKSGMPRSHYGFPSALRISTYLTGFLGPLWSTLSLSVSSVAISSRMKSFPMFVCNILPMTMVPSVSARLFRQLNDTQILVVFHQMESSHMIMFILMTSKRRQIYHVNMGCRMMRLGFWRMMRLGLWMLRWMPVPVECITMRRGRGSDSTGCNSSKDSCDKIEFHNSSNLETSFKCVCKASTLGCFLGTHTFYIAYSIRVEQPSVSLSSWSMCIRLSLVTGVC